MPASAVRRLPTVRQGFKQPPQQQKPAPGTKDGEWVSPGSHGNPAPGSDPRKLS